MGAAAGVMASPRGGTSKEKELFAFQVLHYDRQKGALSIKLDPENPNQLPEKELFNRIDQVWHAAVKEADVPYIECLNPAVIMYKHSLLTEQEVNDINEQILKDIIARDKDLYKANHHSKANTDYSQSFGGTADDTKNEREAAEILRGGDTTETEAVKTYLSPYVTPPTILHQSERQALRNHGKWLRFLSANGCYMYFNTMSHELHSIRPEEFVDEADVPHHAHADAPPVDPANGLPVVSVADLPAEVERIVLELKKTPLLIDTSPNQVARTFYSYKACLEDVSQMTIPFGKSGVKKEDVMERCRKRLVGAMKSGSPFVLYLGAVTIEHADLKGKLCKKVIIVFFRNVFAFVRLSYHLI